jgi:hypothetical protein
MRELGFDNNAYIKIQTEQILKRISEFDNKLYLEFGGKLFDDYHASRVLPGFEIDSKIRILQGLRDRCEIIIVINAGDIEKTKTRSDIGITYDMDVLRLIDNLRRLELPVTAVVIAQYCGQPSADIFRNKLEQRGERTVIHRPIHGYPTDVDLVLVKLERAVQSFALVAQLDTVADDAANTTLMFDGRRTAGRRRTSAASVVSGSDGSPTPSQWYRREDESHEDRAEDRMLGACPETRARDPWQPQPRFAARNYRRSPRLRALR